MIFSWVPTLNSEQIHASIFTCVSLIQLFAAINPGQKSLILNPHCDWIPTLIIFYLFLSEYQVEIPFVNEAPIDQAETKKQKKGKDQVKAEPFKGEE